MAPTSVSLVLWYLPVSHPAGKALPARSPSWMSCWVQGRHAKLLAGQQAGEHREFKLDKKYQLGSERLVRVGAPEQVYRSHNKK